MSRELEIISIAKQREMEQYAQHSPHQIPGIAPLSKVIYYLFHDKSLVPLGAPNFPHSGQPSPLPIHPGSMNPFVHPVPLSPLQIPNQEKMADVVHAIKAMHCFCMALRLAPGSRLENTLRLLQLWFQYGEYDEVYKLLRENIKGLPVETWLEVIPQLMARLDSSERMSSLIKQVIFEVAKSKPQVGLTNV